MTGVAWETGVLVGLAEAGVDVRNADLFLGTSAGANVAAQLTCGLSMDELFQRQVDPTLQAKELSVQLDLKQLVLIGCLCSSLIRMLTHGQTWTNSRSNCSRMGHGWR